MPARSSDSLTDQGEGPSASEGRDAAAPAGAVASPAPSLPTPSSPASRGSASAGLQRRRELLNRGIEAAARRRLRDEDRGAP